MDLYKAIQDLHEEKKRLDHVIETLETVIRQGTVLTQAPLRRRGRKSMNPEERSAVSERMKKYWAMRRKQPAGRKTSSTVGS